MPGHETTLTAIMNKAMVLVALPGFSVTPILMLLKLLHFHAISDAQADWIIALVEPLWPVITLQYESAKKLDSLGSTYYAVLAIVSLVIVVIMLVFSLFRYCVAHRSLQMPSAGEILLCLPIPAVYFIFAVSDAPGEHYAGRWHFFPDYFGAYYIAQYIRFVGCGALTVFCILIVVRVAEEMLRRLRARSN